jgi:hypothetical protein
MNWSRTIYAMLVIVVLWSIGRFSASPKSTSDYIS